MSALVRYGPRSRVRAPRLLLHAFLIATAAVWLFPLLWAVFTSLRPIGDTITHGYVSWPARLGVDNYVNVWSAAELPHYYLNTLLIVVPGVVLTLLLASMVAFAVSQFSWRFNVLVLMIFTAGNLLPPQVIIVPLYWIYLNTPVPIDQLSDNGLLYDQYLGIILIHVVFQTGFAAFVPFVRFPGTAKTSVHMSIIGSRKYRPPVSAVDTTTGPSVRSSHAVE